MSKIPYAIIIRDGFGYNPSDQNNAIAEAHTPNHDSYITKYPTTFIKTSGEAVGLPANTMGSSEVGHLNIGAGRVVWQSLARINKDIQTGDFFNNDALTSVIEKLKGNGGCLHIAGLIQCAGVHAHSDHVLAAMKLAKEAGMARDKVVLHIFSDGRDTPPKSAKKQIQYLTDWMEHESFGRIVTITGRYYAMDRDNRWERVQLAYDVIAKGLSEKDSFADPFSAVEDAYSAAESDEFIKPRLIGEYDGLADGDALFLINFRFDRARELSRAFILSDFDQFDTVELQDFSFIAMTNYYDGLKQTDRADVRVVYQPIVMKKLLGPYLSSLGKTQLRIAETEKYAHVTFFFNGQSDEVSVGECHMGPDSPNVATYDLAPEMSAEETTRIAIEQITSGQFDLIVLNFANCDMVGHTGIHPAIVKAVEKVDECVGRVVDAIIEQNGIVLLSADHGNGEQTLDYITGEPLTSHTMFDVWCSLISSRPELQKDKLELRKKGSLADLAPTLLETMGIIQPEEMTGQSLIQPL